MNYKKKSFILSILFILSIQILFLINNRQKSPFIYLIWRIEEVSIGRLVCISFTSGLLISCLLRKSLDNDFRTFQKNDSDDKFTNDNNYSINREDENESYEIPPERDLRDVQPTISVNYRVIKDNGNNESYIRDKKTSRKPKYQDDWVKNESEW